MIKIRHKGIELTVNAADGDSILHALAEAGVYLAAPCGGKGKCGKCRVRLIGGTVGGEVADGKGTIRACKASVAGDAELETLEGNTEEVTAGAKKANAIKRAGVAIDIGTTTVVASLVDLDTGEVAETFSALNAQGIFGADVISRITAATAGKTKLLNTLIINQTNKIIDGFIKRNGLQNIESASVSANTTMLHLFANVNPQSIGVIPFKPVFKDAREYSGATLGLNAGKCYLMPSIAGFLGADITAGIVEERVFDTDKTTLLIDIGTNGEMALNHGGKLYCCSTATGPALEGAEISCGKGGTAGAIDHVFTGENSNSKAVKGERFSCTTIGGIAADGICGSGLIDAIAVMLKLNEIDESGAMENGEQFALSEKVFISRRDVRQFQLAKSALISGIKLLSKAASTTVESIQKVIITGGLGFYLNAKSAIAVGMLPQEFDGKIQISANLSLKGAVSYLLSDEYKKNCDSVSKACVCVDLASDPQFMDEFSNNMMFE